MVEFWSNHQLDIMLALSSVCATIVLSVIVARALPTKRRLILLFLELSAMLLLYFDRMTYMYDGAQFESANTLMKVANFIVFALTDVVTLALNLYLIDLLKNEGEVKETPVSLRFCNLLLSVGILLVIFSQFTDLYYYIDEYNVYHRSDFFVISYIAPVVSALIQLWVLIQNRKRITRGIFISIVLFIVVPILASLLQFYFNYLALTNVALVGMAVLVFMFALDDINRKIKLSQKHEIEYLQEESNSNQRLLKQTAAAFIGALEAKNPYTVGHSERVAKYALLIASTCGKSKRECDEIYFSALLHDIGKIGLPDTLVSKTEDLTFEEQMVYREKNVIGSEILSNITEFPYLGDGAHYINERYDGKGYPDGLKGDNIPENARILAVADYYDELTSKKIDRDHYPQFIVREEMVKGAGNLFDPRFAGVMVSLIDKDTNYALKDDMDDITPDLNFETELDCDEYRTTVSRGILIEENYKTITYDWSLRSDSPTGFSSPSIILFDSYDGRIHPDAKNIEAFGYVEYGEIWFSGHNISTNARDIQVKMTDMDDEVSEFFRAHYEISVARLADHLKIKVVGDGRIMDVIVALPDISKYAYLSLTGEYCHIQNITIEQTDKQITEYEFERIAPVISYLNRMEGDLPNFQIDKTRSASTKGVLIEDGLNVLFHSMSLPSSKLIWHCPYVVIFSSSDGKVNGPNYREYALIKFNGENESSTIFAENDMTINYTNEFYDWELWKRKNKEGVDCKVSFRKKLHSIESAVECGGVLVHNNTLIKDMVKDVYFALTGDECALTDIRIYKF